MSTQLVRHLRKRYDVYLFVMTLSELGRAYAKIGPIQYPGNMVIDWVSHLAQLNTYKYTHT